MMKLVDFEHISRLGITPAECVSWADHIIRHKYECELPAKISIHLPENVFVNTMPSYIPDENVYGVKVVNRYPHRVPSLESCIMLFDSVTGEELALMDGTWVTAMRTGAVAALAVRHLRKHNAKEYAFMGLGNTCRATLLCMQAMEPEREIHVRLLAHKGQENDFMDRFRDFCNISFTIVNDTESLVRGAEVILSCVTAADGLSLQIHAMMKESWLFLSIPEVSRTATCSSTRCSRMIPPMSADSSISTSSGLSMNFPMSFWGKILEENPTRNAYFHII